MSFIVCELCNVKSSILGPILLKNHFYFIMYKNCTKRTFSKFVTKLELSSYKFRDPALFSNLYDQCIIWFNLIRPVVIVPCMNNFNWGIKYVSLTLKVSTLDTEITGLRSTICNTKFRSRLNSNFCYKLMISVKNLKKINFWWKLTIKGELNLVG